MSKYPDLKESTIRNFKKAYKERLDEQRKKLHPDPITSIDRRAMGRPPILMDLDAKLITFLQALRQRGGVINIHIVRASAQALINSHQSSVSVLQLQSFSMSRSWVQSIYRRMGYSRRMRTISRPPVPRGLYNECQIQFITEIDAKMKEFNIPPELILNADQTPSSYISVGRSTMAQRRSKDVAVKGLGDKRNITVTFVVTLSGEFLPMQIIYGGKTKASLPRFQFPKGFSLSQNPKHWSNEQETLRLIQEIINPYLVRKRAKLNLPPSSNASSSGMFSEGR